MDEIPWEEMPPPDAPPDNVYALPGTQQIEVSEDAIALEFTRQHKDTMRFDHDIGKWYQWQASRWSPIAIPAAFHYAREIGRRLGAGKKQICKASVAGGAERFARADPAHAVTASLWDADPWLLGTPTGTLNLRTGRMHAPRREEFITMQTGCSPEKKSATLWMRFLSEATRGDEQVMLYLQRIAGYCLTGATTEHALFFIYGPGGNGKSVFQNILVHILGDYARSAPMDTFTSSKFSSHPTELAMLKGARLVTATETEEGRAWAEARIKALTGGDPITARFMRQDFFTYQPAFKLLFSGNHQPSLGSVDPAMRRRFNMLPFLHKPSTPDGDLEIKLREEAPRILAWALEGCLAWQRSGLQRPDAVAEATNEYFEDQDVFGAWLESRCIVARNEFEPIARLFRDWSEYARSAGELPGTVTTFAAKLRKGGFSKKHTALGRVYQGLSLRPRERGDDDG